MQESLGGCIDCYIRDAGGESSKNNKYYQQSLLGVVIYSSSQSFEAKLKSAPVILHAGSPVIRSRVTTLERGNEKTKIQFTLS